MQSESHDLSIEEILARVRAETAAEKPASPQEPPRRKGLGNVPLVAEPDDGQTIPLGKAHYTIEEFAALDDEDFLKNAYRVLLGREIDGAGRNYYLPALRQGHIGVVRVLSALSRSEEGRTRGIKIRWLLPAAIVDRLSSLPGVGKLVAPFMRFLVRSTTNQRLSLLSKRHQELITDINAALTAIRKSHVEFNMRVDLTEQDARESLAASQVAKEALSEIKAIRQEISGQRAALGELTHAARASLPPAGQAAAARLASHSLDAFYVALENRFRGSTSEIAKRAERYLTIFRKASPVAAGGIVLDIGCGRGEFLSLLRQNNIVGRGVDLNGAMVAEAQALELDVVEADALYYLRGQPDDTFAAITGFHIVEHIPFQDLICLFDEARRVLMPGGFVLFETPNPENLVVGACTFHLDPTHNKPLPPDYLAFMAEARGFSITRIIRTDSDCDLSQPESGFQPLDVNDWFRQPADYALYAGKTEQHEPA